MSTQDILQDIQGTFYCSSILVLYLFGFGNSFFFYFNFVLDGGNVKQFLIPSLHQKEMRGNFFSVCLQNRLLSAGLEPTLNLIEFISLNYTLRPLEANKTGCFDLYIFVILNFKFSVVYSIVR